MSLPDDVIHEILVRLFKEDDMAALFRCASTCKRWSRLVAEVRRLDHTSPSSSFLSGFLVRKRIGVFCTDRSSMTSLVPTQQWVFKPHRLLLGSFFPETAAGGRLGRAVPLVARHGLLLARLPSSDVEIDRRSGCIRTSIVHLVVCNLLAGTWHVLPPVASNWTHTHSRSWRYGESGYAIFTEADRSSNISPQPSSTTTPPRGYSPPFKILAVYTDGTSCILNTYSSSEARWNTPVDVGSGTRKVGISGPLKHPNAVVCRGGMAHWLISSWRDGVYTVGVDAETGHVTVTKVDILTENFSPETCDEPQLGVAADGTLSLLFLRRPGLAVNIFVRRHDHHRGSGGDGGGPTGGWILGRVVELKPPEPRTLWIQGEAAHLTLVGERCGTLLVRDNSMRLYAVDLESGRMTELTFCGRVDRWKVVPFEIYWPTF